MEVYRLTTKVWIGPQADGNAEDKRQAIQAIVERCQRRFNALARQGEQRKAMLEVTSNLSMLLTTLGSPQAELEAQQLYGHFVRHVTLPMQRQPATVYPWDTITDHLIKRYAS